MVTVCLIAPNFNIEDVDPELTADGTSSFLYHHHP